MCGIFGAWGAYPIPLFRQAAAAAGRRGTDAHGWAIPGALRKHPGALDPAGLPAASPIIGHARLATGLNATDLGAAHPHASRDVALVHNGVVPDPDRWDRWMRPVSTCDSELLAIGIAREEGTPVARVARAVAAMLQEEPFALLCLFPDRIVAARRGLPLFLAEGLPGGEPWVVLASGAFGEAARPLPEGIIHEWPGPERWALPRPETPARRESAWRRLGRSSDRS